MGGIIHVYVKSTGITCNCKVLLNTAVRLSE